MLKQLRIKLTLISTITTGTILAFVCILALRLFENQVNHNNLLAFDNHLNTIAYQLQHNHVIKHSWLAQIETQHNLIISIEDNGNPFLFQGSWQTSTPRDYLLSQSKEILQQDTPRALLQQPSFLNLKKNFFYIEGLVGDTYRGGIGIIPSSTGSYTLTVLQDLSAEQTKLLHTRFLFISISLIGMCSLGIFSLWFSNRAIRPIDLAGKKQKDFIASASHELKGPLAVIYAHASSVKNNSFSNDAAYTAIEKECNRLSRLIDDLLLLATMDSSAWAIEQTSIEIDVLLIELLDTYLPLTKEKCQHLSLSLPDDLLPTLFVDEERIKQVLCILIDNALHYVPEYGKITLHVSADTSYVSIAIIDNGPGIPSSHQPFIFDRFYRVDCARKDKNHYGLGLSIAQEIIGLHGGTLIFKSTPGGGATFTIKLPIKKR